MSLAPQELENSASKYASEAIKCDSQGARGMAIANYQKAIDALVNLMRLYPNNKLNKIYTERTTSYQKRIKVLQKTHGADLEHAVDPNASPEQQKKSLEQHQESQDSFEDLIMKEKQEAERKRIEARGIADFQRVVSRGIKAQLLQGKGIEATEKLASSTNAKVIIVGAGKSGLPLILGQ